MPRSELTPKGSSNSRERTAPPARLRPRKTATLLAQQILSEITDQGLKPGTSLLAERDMLQYYGVARGTLREALRFLEMQGVLTIKPGPAGGPTVNGVEPRSFASAIALLLQLSNAHFTTILEARQLLEPSLAALSAERATDAEIGALGESIEAMARSLDDHDAFLIENRAFHDLVADASGNELFSLLVRSLEWIMDASVLGVVYDKKRRNGILTAHRAIYASIAARDPAKAQEAMIAHMDEFGRYLNRHHAAVLDKPVRWDETVN